MSNQPKHNPKTTNPKGVPKATPKKHVSLSYALFQNSTPITSGDLKQAAAARVQAELIQPEHTTQTTAKQHAVGNTTVYKEVLSLTDESANQTKRPSILTLLRYRTLELFTPKGIVLAGIFSQDPNSLNLAYVRGIIEHLRDIYRVPLCSSDRILDEGTSTFQAVKSFGQEGKTKNARTVGGIISSTAEQLSVYLELDPSFTMPVGECSIQLPTAAVYALEFKITHDLLQNPDTDMIRRLMRDMRIAALPFEFDATLITSDDALTHHGKTSWTREMLLLPIGAFAEDSLASVYLDVYNVIQFAVTEDQWEYLLQHMFLLPQHIHGNEDTHANHLGLAMYFLFDADREELNSSIRFAIRRLFQVELHPQNIALLGHLYLYITRSSAPRSHMDPALFKIKLTPAPQPWIAWFAYLPATWGSSDLATYLMLTLQLTRADIVWIFFTYPNLNERTMKMHSLQRVFGVVCKDQRILTRMFAAAHIMTEHIRSLYTGSDAAEPSISHANAPGNLKGLPILRHLKTDTSLLLPVPTPPTLATLIRHIQNDNGDLENTLTAHEQLAHAPKIIPTSHSRTNDKTATLLSSKYHDTAKAAHSSNSVVSSERRTGSSITAQRQGSQSPPKRQRGDEIEMQSSPLTRDRLESDEEQSPQRRREDTRTSDISQIESALETLQLALTSAKALHNSQQPEATFKQILHLLEDAFPDQSEAPELYESYLSMTTQFLSHLLPTGSLTITAHSDRGSLSESSQARRIPSHLTPHSQSSTQRRDFQKAGGSRV